LTLFFRIISLAISSFILLGSDFPQTPYVVVLGTAQDGGLPHAGCKKQCCENTWGQPNAHKQVACIGIIDPQSGKSWIIDATPDFPAQAHTLTQIHPTDLEGIFLSHAHIGHYTGLIHLGREVMGAKKEDVFAMPRMRSFLENNGPWNQLVKLNNIAIQPMRNGVPIKLMNDLWIEPFLVPHRDEYSETVGFRISGPSRSLVYIPDIDKWSKWETNIETIVMESSFALLDGTFFAGNEIPNRNMADIPHPFVVESMNLMNHIPQPDKNKIHFIHLNHSNPLHNPDSPESAVVNESGFKVARKGQIFPL
jgi:pyrroloquinoline quinone biosynthesis protein B